MTPIVRAWRSFGVPLRVTAEGSGWPQSIVRGSCRHPALWSLEFRVRCPIRVTARGYKLDGWCSEDQVSEPFLRGSSDVAPFRGGRGPSTVARPVAYVGDSPDGPLRALIIDDRMTLPWGGRVPLQSALHRQARPIRSRSRGVVREVLQTGGPQSAPHAQWRPIIGASRGGALVQHTGGAFNRSWSSNAPLRRRLLTVAEGCDIVASAWAQGSAQASAIETVVVAAALRATPTTRGQRYVRAPPTRDCNRPAGPFAPLRSRSRAAESAVGWTWHG